MTDWFVKKPGDVVSPSVEDPTMALVGGSVPDWVRLPPELGGTQVKVEGAHDAPCPKCRAPEPVRHLALAGGVQVAECTGPCGFVWYRRRA